MDNRCRIVLDTDTTHNPAEAQQFGTRTEATAATKLVPGYRPHDVTRICVMGFYMWALCDAHMRYLTRSGYARWAEKK